MAILAFWLHNRFQISVIIDAVLSFFPFWHALVLQGFRGLGVEVSGPGAAGHKGFGLWAKGLKVLADSEHM